MTKDQFDTAHRAFYKRRPFRKFSIEFTSGHQLSISHPELIRNKGSLYAMRCPDGGHVVFAAESVSRLLDLPIAPS